MELVEERLAKLEQRMTLAVSTATEALENTLTCWQRLESIARKVVSLSDIHDLATEMQGLLKKAVAGISTAEAGAKTMNEKIAALTAQSGDIQAGLNALTAEVAKLQSMLAQIEKGDADRSGSTH